MKENNIKKVLLLGSGALKIGEAGVSNYQLFLLPVLLNLQKFLLQKQFHYFLRFYKKQYNYFHYEEYIQQR